MKIFLVNVNDGCTIILPNQSALRAREPMRLLQANPVLLVAQTKVVEPSAHGKTTDLAAHIKAEVLALLDKKTDLVAHIKAVIPDLLDKTTALAPLAGPMGLIAPGKTTDLVVQAKVVDSIAQVRQSARGIKVNRL